MSASPWKARRSTQSARQIGDHGALLFPVFTSERAEVGAGAEPDFFAYCIEMSVRALFDVEVDLGPWREFPGSNRFTDDPRVQQRVGWIIAHSYPTLSLAELRQVTGISGLTQREAIAGTQYAIWHLTDGDGRELSANAEALRAYLTGPANTGLPERATRPGLSLTMASGANDLIGAPIGPITVGANVEPVTLDLEDGVNIVDGAGAPADVTAVLAGAEVFLELPRGLSRAARRCAVRYGPPKPMGPASRFPRPMSANPTPRPSSS